MTLPGPSPRLLERALALSIATFDENHPNVSYILYSMGHVCRGLGYAERARTLLVRAAAIAGP